MNVFSSFIALAVWSVTICVALFMTWVVLFIWAALDKNFSGSKMFNYEAILQQLTSFYIVAGNSLLIDTTGYVVKDISALYKTYFGSVRSVLTTLGLFALCVLASSIMAYQADSIKGVDWSYKCATYPIYYTYVFPVMNSARIVYDSLVGVFISTSRVGWFYSTGWLSVVAKCEAANFRTPLNSFGNIVSDASAATVAFWSTPAGDHIDFKPLFSDFGDLVEAITPAFKCACNAMSPLWEFLGGVFKHESFALAADSFLNTLVTLFGMPIRYVENLALKDLAKRATLDAPDYTDSRPNVTQLFDNVCNTSLYFGAWVDDVIQDAISDVDVEFGGAYITIPRFMCLFSTPACAVAASLELTLNSLIRADVLQNPWIADEYIDFTKVEKWLGEFSSCLENTLAHLDKNLGCSAGSLSRFVTSVTMGLITMAKYLWIDLAEGRSAGYTLSDLWVRGNFDQSFANFDAFASCAGALVSEFSIWLGCLVSMALVLLSSLAQAILLIGVAVGDANTSDKTFASIIVEQWESGELQKPFSALNATGTCLFELGTSLSPSLGCFMSSVVQLLTYTVEIPFYIAYLFFKASDTGASFWTLVVDDWESGGHLTAWYDIVDQVGWCLGSLVGLASPGLGCAIYNAVKVACLAVMFFFQTVVVAIKGAATKTPLAHVFLTYLNEGRYGGFDATMVAVADCIQSVGLDEPVTRFVTCVVGGAIRVSSSVICSVAFTVVSIVVAKQMNENYAGLLCDGWVDETAPYKQVFDRLEAAVGCLSELLSRIAPNVACFIYYTLVSTVLAVRGFLDAVAQFSRGLIHGEGVVGMYLFEAWNAGNYTAPFDSLKNAGRCAGSIVSEWDVPLGCAVVSSVGFVSDVIYSIAFVLIIVAEALSGVADPGELLIDAWDSGPLQSVFEDLESLAYCAGQTISFINSSLACFVSSTGVAAVRVLHNAVGLVFSLISEWSVGGTFSTAYAKGEFSEVWEVLDAAAVCLGDLAGEISSRLTCAVRTVAQLSIASTRLVFKVFSDFAIAGLALENPFHYAYNDYKTGGMDFFFDRVDLTAACTASTLSLAYEPLGCAAGAAVSMLDPLLRSVFMIVFTVSESARAGDNFASAFANIVYQNWLSGDLYIFFTYADRFSPCFHELDSLLDPTNHCAIASTIDFLTTFGVNVVTTVTIAVSLLSDEISTGEFLEDEWYNGKLNSTFYDFDQMAACQGSVAVSYFYPKAGCVYSSVLSAASAAVMVLVDGLVLVERSFRTGTSFLSTASSDLENTSGSGSVAFFISRIEALGSCLGSLLHDAYPPLGCAVQHALVSAALFASFLLDSVVLIAFSVENGVGYGTEMFPRWFSGVYDGAFNEFYELCGCFGMAFGNGHLSYAVSSVARAPMGLFHDAIGFLLLADYSASNGQNFGFMLQHHLDSGSLRSGTRFASVAATHLRGWLSEWSPAIACAIATPALLGVEAVNVLVQVVADASKGVPSGEAFGLQFLYSWNEGKYRPVLTALDSVGPCLQQVGNLISPQVGCFAGRLYAVGSGLVQDVAEFSVVVTEAAVTSNTFAQAFSSAWNNGSMSHTLTALGDSAYCVNNLLGLVSSRIACFPTQAILLTKAIVTAIVQAVVSVFFQKDFQSQWENGKFSYVFESLDGLFDCLSELVGLINSDLGCIVQTLLVYIDSVVKDSVDFLIALSRSIKNNTNFGDELQYAIYGGGLNATFTNTENLAFCTGDLGEFPGGPSYTCLLSTSLQVGIYSSFLTFIS